MSKGQLLTILVVPALANGAETSSTAAAMRLIGIAQKDCVGSKKVLYGPISRDIEAARDGIGVAIVAKLMLAEAVLMDVPRMRSLSGATNLANFGWNGQRVYCSDCCGY